MLFFVFSNAFAVHPKGIFSKYYDDKIIVLDASGSSRQEINGTMQRTKPEYAIYPWDKTYDWCSNCYRTYDEHPWIMFSLERRIFKFNSYFVRAGCCYSNRCVCDIDLYYCVDCCLYSWKLQISDDNKTWTDVHKIEKDYDMRRCAEKIYKLDKEYTAKYVRLTQTEACPGDPPCIALNKFDLIGEIIREDYYEEFSPILDDDDVSIIGHISKNGQMNQ